GSYMEGLGAGLAGPIIGLLAGIFSYGGIYAARLIDRQNAQLTARFPDERLRSEALRQENLRWLNWAALSFAALAAFAIPFPPIAPVLGAHLAALANVVGLQFEMLVGIVLGVGTLVAVWRPKLSLVVVGGLVALAFSPAVALAAAVAFGLGIIQ